MRKAGILMIFAASAAALATTAFAQAARTKVVATRGAHQATPVQVSPIIDGCRGSFICRQDLFDRNNPNNLRSDYHAPPAQPGQH